VVKNTIQEILKLSDHSDDDLLEMYAQKEELEKAAQQAEQEYYAWKGSITETENNISNLRRKKDNV
jgi:chromosome segregation protein